MKLRARLPKSIRIRLTLWYSLALAAGLVLFGLGTWLSMWRSLGAAVDRTLAAQTQSIETFLNAEAADPNQKLPEELDEYSQGLPFGMCVAVTDHVGLSIFNSNPSFPWRHGHGEQHWRGRNYRVLASNIHVQGRPWRVSLAIPLESMETTLSLLRMLLLIFIPAVILVASFGGAWLSRRALKPVDAITAAARSIEIGNLSARLDVPQTGDELQRLSETLNSMLTRLEDAVARLSRFTADASHELRTPLTVIRATAEIAARKDRSTESYRATLTQVVMEADRMTSLIDDLLFLARCDVAHPDIAVSELTLASVVEELAAELRPWAEAKRIRLVCHPLDRDAIVLGNKPAIRRLVLALLDNAVKYSQPGGAVIVTLTSGQFETRLEVSDNGPGIPDSEIERVFERFYRTPSARESGAHGHGLGLSLVASIAQHHHARVTVTSKAEAGCTFSVVFPMAACNPKEQTVPAVVSL